MTLLTFVALLQLQAAEPAEAAERFDATPALGAVSLVTMLGAASAAYYGAWRFGLPEGRIAGDSVGLIAGALVGTVAMGLGLLIGGTMRKTMDEADGAGAVTAIALGAGATGGVGMFVSAVAHGGPIDGWAIAGGAGAATVVGLGMAGLLMVPGVKDVLTRMPLSIYVITSMLLSTSCGIFVESAIASRNPAR